MELLSRRCGHDGGNGGLFSVSSEGRTGQVVLYIRLDLRKMASMNCSDCVPGCDGLAMVSGGEQADTRFNHSHFVRFAAVP